MHPTDPQDQTTAAPASAAAPMDWFIVHTYSGFEDRVVLELTNRIKALGMESHFGEIRVPTLVVHCRDDQIVPFEEGRLMASLIPGARFVPLESNNHILLETEPAWPQFLSEVTQFTPSETEPAATLSPRIELKILTTAATALEEMGVRDARRHIAVLRSWGSISILVKRSPLSGSEVEKIRRFARERWFDLACLPEMLVRHLQIMLLRNPLGVPNPRTHDVFRPPLGQLRFTSAPQVLE